MQELVIGGQFSAPPLIVFRLFLVSFFKFFIGISFNLLPTLYAFRLPQLIYYLVFHKYINISHLIEYLWIFFTFHTTKKPQQMLRL
ncbi:hypothetical protein C1637_01270 [Chryseobacterium lactis]|uniref:Uncharacterized protein n=1 Tax=Chryseobacterium lactis TaxID=1241981 RepID=A0A3G6RQV9_CHRLC|nr:hypothetical protein EG342_04655 [Chryseobacterium lactis]AZB06233.1 hypothetical protein EG341_20780 [Chryseobacterium lactis]PNW15085.1 hypothetical protein C1637_01270 [Chryseobacterium lactis]